LKQIIGQFLVIIVSTKTIRSIRVIRVRAQTISEPPLKDPEKRSSIFQKSSSIFEN